VLREKHVAAANSQPLRNVAVEIRNETATARARLYGLVFSSVTDVYAITI
jgi:hypothetical protein